jgi:putative transposase
MRDSLGHWYASFVVSRFDPKWETAPHDAVGIDWGVSTIANANDKEYDLPHPEFGKKAAQRLARYQRQMARRKPKRGTKASRGYRKAKHNAAKTYKKVARQREDTARKWSRRVVSNHNRLAVEDFKPTFLAKSTMARKSSDAAIGATKKHLLYYAQQAQRQVVLVAPAYTTMTCSKCLTRAKSKLALNQRVFSCYACGFVAGRDRNAAGVCLVLAGFVQADVDAVRRADSHFVALGLAS